MKYKYTTAAGHEIQVANVDVAFIQEFLNSKGANLRVDGIAGTLTKAAFIPVFVNKKAVAITPPQLAEIAAMLGDTNTKRIKAVASVESNGSGWFNSGLVKILFERHKFWQFSEPKDRKITWYSNPKAGGYTNDADNNGINDSWEKLAQAVCVNPIAALKSVSMGKFQVMGMWHKECGFNHPIEMLWAVTNSEYEHYKLLANYILNVAKIKRQFLQVSSKPSDCIPFVRAYNGSGYAKGRYHIKLAEAMK